MSFIVNRSLRTAGIARSGQAGTNTLRFTCAATLLRAGTDPVDVADILGYASLGSVERFLHDQQAGPAGGAPPGKSAHLQQTIDY